MVLVNLALTRGPDLCGRFINRVAAVLLADSSFVRTVRIQSSVVLCHGLFVGMVQCCHAFAYSGTLAMNVLFMGLRFRYTEFLLQVLQLRNSSCSCFCRRKMESPGQRRRFAPAINVLLPMLIERSA
jgi:hypothetical protein